MTQTDFTSLPREIAEAEVPTDGVAIWWLGQASFVVRAAGQTVYFDPFLGPNPDRLVQPPFSPHAAPPAGLVLVTHEHIDHLDPPSVRGLAETNREAKFVAPAPILDQMARAGVPEDRLTGAQPGDELEFGPAKVLPVPAMHGISSPPAEYSFGREESGGQYRFLGYVLELATVRVYHGGDTIAYDGMIETVGALQPDVAILPINGRSYFREQRGIIGNLNEHEAAEVAAGIGAKLLIPAHYEMFAANLGSPAALVEYVRGRYPELSMAVPALGRRLTYIKGDFS